MFEKPTSNLIEPMQEFLKAIKISNLVHQFEEGERYLATPVEDRFPYLVNFVRRALAGNTTLTTEDLFFMLNLIYVTRNSPGTYVALGEIFLEIIPDGLEDGDEFARAFETVEAFIRDHKGSFKEAALTLKEYLHSVDKLVHIGILTDGEGADLIQNRFDPAVDILEEATTKFKESKTDTAKTGEGDGSESPNNPAVN